MNTRNFNKQGISLTVLVITIIVMIILATSVVITLNNSRIIEKANEAVEATNLAQVRDLAKMLWADAYLDKTIPKDQIEGVVLAKLKEAIGESNFSKYTITVTASGINVEKKKDPAPVITLDSELSEDSTNPTVATGTSYTLTGKVTDEKGIKSFTINGVAVTVAQDGTWSTTLTLVKDKLTEVTLIATDTSGNTTTKTGYVGYITFTNFTITAANRHKVGYDANAATLDLEIPETFYDEEDGKWKVVTKLGDDAFRDCANLTSVVIPDSVTSIGAYAFNGCSSLTSITIPESVTSIGYGAFNGCTNLESVIFTGNSVLTTIGGFAFEGCKNLKSINLPEGVTSLGEHAFKSCSSLENINIPDSVTFLGGSAFASCSSLKSINLPDNITTVASWSFQNCTKLKDVVLPANLTRIESYVFEGCVSLEHIIIPSGVTSTGRNVFNGCTKLQTITIPASVKQMDYGFITSSTGVTGVIFENPNGWKVSNGTETIEVNAGDLADASVAKKLLTSTYRYPWTWSRSDS